MSNSLTHGGSASAEMPRYLCHKQVWALKVARVEGCTIFPADAGYAPFDVTPDLYLRYTPTVGDYYVVYADGYKSFSPAKAFTEGYVPEPLPLNFQDRVRAEAVELEEKLKKLLSFQHTETFLALPLAERNCLLAQAAAMSDYSNCLSERIQNFESAHAVG